MIANEKGLLPAIVEKDYWLMHCLWGIQQQGYNFELKGGTSLSKGFNIIERFSEDIDIQIRPKHPDEVKIGRNHDKAAHVKSRKNFFDKIVTELNVVGLRFERDTAFDDDTGKMRSAGIRGMYHSFFSNLPELKPGIVLELGFDQTTPNLPSNITSWAYDRVSEFEPSLIDNRAKQVCCYCPEYTFIEKLQTISTKYRLHQEKGTMPANFLRHYYDIYKLLENDRVLNFISSPEYIAHKNKRFRTGDEKNISSNHAFNMPDQHIKIYGEEFHKKSAMYFGEQPKFEDILVRIIFFSDKL